MKWTSGTATRWVILCGLLLAGGCEELDFAFPVLRDSGDDGGGSEARYALFLGIDHYSPAYISSPLNSCINDANGFSRKLAADTDLWKDVEDDKLPSGMTLWTDSQCRLSAVRAKMQELAGVAKSGDLVVFFQSSHGGRSSGMNAFLCMYDASYRDTVFAADLAGFADGVKIVVVLDACFSAGIYKDGDVAEPWDFPQRVMDEVSRIRKDKSGEGPNIGWLASSDYNETSLAGNPYSRFTGFLIAAFCSGDASDDGKLTFKELFDYAAPRTRPSHYPQSRNDALLSATVAAKKSCE